MGKIEKLTLGVGIEPSTAAKPTRVPLPQAPRPTRLSAARLEPTSASASYGSMRRNVRGHVGGRGSVRAVDASGINVSEPIASVKSLRASGEDDRSIAETNAALLRSDPERRQATAATILHMLKATLAQEERSAPACHSNELMACLCAAAVDAGVDVETVRTVLDRRQSVADPTILNRPWPIRIYTLGRFALVKDGAPVVYAGKSPRRSLELLQALIALGGREVPTSALMQAVWPEEKSADLRKLFDNTVHRLRKILGFDGAILMHDSKLTLDARNCWVDAWAFDRLARQQIAGTASTEQKLEDVLQLYQGHFLERDDNRSWMMVYRDRLCSRLQRLIITVGARLETAGRWEEAAAVYERGLEIDNLSERFYQRLMICRWARREYAETVRVYRRCSELLSIVLGVPPSAETETIRRNLLQSAADGCALERRVDAHACAAAAYCVVRREKSATRNPSSQSAKK